MAGVKLIERAKWDLFTRWTNKEIELKRIRSIAKEMIRHIEMQDEEIERLKRKNNKLERKHWEIKLKYEKEE